MVLYDFSLVRTSIRPSFVPFIALFSQYWLSIFSDLHEVRFQQTHKSDAALFLGEIFIRSEMKQMGHFCSKNQHF